ncbi:MAG: extracellular solute-binding protein, partial [Chloroflexota bacterium]
MNTKRLSVLLLVALLSLVIFVPAQAQDGATIPAVTCAEPGTLTLRVWDQNWAATLQDATAAWVEEYCPGAEVQVEQVPYAQYWELLPIDASSGDLPDVFNMSQDNFVYYANNGALLDLQPYFDENGLDASVWGTGLVDPYRYGENQDVYGAPLEWVTAGIYYNKDMFDAAGLDYPTADWTWDDFAT